MKNIYNLITDLFTAMNEDETKYMVEVEFGGVMLVWYDIRICARDTSAQTYAGITLILNDSLEPYEYHQHNRHFQRWDNIIPILERLLVE